MKKPRQYVFFTVVLILAYLLNACSGVPAGAQQLSDAQNSPVTSAADDVNDNSEVDNANETNANDENVNDDQDENSNSDDETNTNDENVNDDDQGEDNDDQGENEDQEVIGTVEAITADSITIDGVTYLIADFTEFNDLISVGDQVKIHVIVNADGTFTISEIELTDETSVDNDNGDDDDQGVSDNANEDDQGEDEQGEDGGDNSGDDGEHDGSNSNGDD